MPRLGILAVLLWLVSSTLQAQEATDPQPDFADLVAAQKVLRAEIKAGKQTFAPDDQKALLKAQDVLFAIAQDNPADADLSESEWVKIFNAQEQINQIVTASAADQRVVCRRERPTGSNRTRSVCLTVAQWRSMQSSQADIQRLSREGSTGARAATGSQ
jgi:hypothetical protein